MPTDVSLVTCTDQGVRNVKDGPTRLDAAKTLRKDMGGELKAVYLTMGADDLVTVAEAPNDETVAKFVLTVASARNIRTVTMKAFPEADYRELLSTFP